MAIKVSNAEEVAAFAAMTRSILFDEGVEYDKLEGVDIAGGRGLRRDDTFFIGG